MKSEKRGEIVIPQEVKDFIKKWGITGNGPEGSTWYGLPRVWLVEDYLEDNSLRRTEGYSLVEEGEISELYTDFVREVRDFANDVNGYIEDTKFE